MDGGKLMGEGTYGCAFYPHLPCEDGTRRAEGIGKIFKREDDLEEEMEVNNIVRRIDPHNIFTVPYLGKCYVDDAAVKPEDKASGCKKFVQGRQQQLLYRFGGINLYRFYSDHVTYGRNFYLDDIAPLLVPVLEGIATMVQRGLVHSDIKPDNMVYDPAAKKIYLIDFGMAMPAKYLWRQEGLLKYDYPFYPPECLVMSRILERQAFDTQLMQAFVKRFDPAFLTPFDNLHGSLQHDFDRMIKDAKWMGNDMFVKSFTKDYVKKFDSYSIGISFLEVVFFGKLKVRDEQLRKRFVALLLDMTRMHPRDRMGPGMAAARLRDICGMRRTSLPRNTTHDRAIADCKRLSTTQIKGKLSVLGLSVAGTKEVMCERLVKATKTTAVPLKTTATPLKTTIALPTTTIALSRTDAAPAGKKCEDLLAKEIKARLRAKGLSQQGNKKQMCDRLAKGDRGCVGMRVDDIKALLRANGLPQYGNKKEMCERLKKAGVVASVGK